MRWLVNWRLKSAAAMVALFAVGTASAQSPVATWVTEAQAQEILAQVCVATHPTFAAARDRRVALGIDVPSKTEADLFYHRELNLSIKVFVDDGLLQCSMVYAMIGFMPSTPSSFLPDLLKLDAAAGWKYDKLGSFVTLITREGATAGIVGPVKIRPNLYNVAMVTSVRNDSSQQK